MSKQRTRIDRVAARYEMRAEAVWSAISAGGEKCGPEGGWWVVLSDDEGYVTEVMGLNVAEVIDEIDRVGRELRADAEHDATGPPNDRN